MLTEQYIDAAPKSQHETPETDSSWPTPATVDDMVEALTSGQLSLIRMVEETLRQLWDSGQLKDLAKLFKAIRTKYVAAVTSNFPTDEIDPKRGSHLRSEQKSYKVAHYKMMKLLERATEGNGIVLRPYLREQAPLTDSQREHFGRLWNATERDLRRRARMIDPDRADELLSDCVNKLIRQEVFSQLAPDYDVNRFRFLACKCMFMAHRMNRTEDAKKHQKLGRFLIRSKRFGWAKSRVVEFVLRQEAAAVLLFHIAKLTPGRREAIISHFFEELTPKEIAARGEVTEEGASHAIARGLGNLRDLVPDHFDPGGCTVEESKVRAIWLWKVQGVRLARVAERFGVNENAVRGWLKHRTPPKKG